MIVSPLEEYHALLARFGVSLAPLSPRDIGLLRSDALKAVEVLRHAECPVLGGDVYLRRGDRFAVTYDNWFTNRKPAEDREAYLRRSWDTTDAYIKNYPESADAEVLFVIVFEAALGGDIDQTAGKR